MRPGDALRSASSVGDGFIVAIHAEKEATNCGIADTAGLDWHFWIVATEAEASNPDTSRRRIHSVVGEVTPHVRAAHKGEFDKEQIMRWARDGVRVRVSGWTMLDSDHPDDAEPDKTGRPGSRGRSGVAPGDEDRAGEAMKPS